MSKNDYLKINKQIVRKNKDGSETLLGMEGYRVLREPSYVKVYLDKLDLLKGISYKASRCLNVLLRIMNYDNDVILTKFIKEDMCISMGVSISTFNHSMGELIDNPNKIMIKASNNHYIINPEIYAKGVYKDVVAVTKKFKELTGTNISNELPTSKELENGQ